MCLQSIFLFTFPWKLRPPWALRPWWRCYPSARGRWRRGRGTTEAPCWRRSCKMTWRWKRWSETKMDFEDFFLLMKVTWRWKRWSETKCFKNLIEFEDFAKKIYFNKAEKISPIFCKTKLQQIINSADTIQHVLGSKPRWHQNY